MKYFQEKDVGYQKLELQYYIPVKEEMWAISFNDKTHRYTLWFKSKSTKKILQKTTSIEMEKLINMIPHHKIKN